MIRQQSPLKSYRYVISESQRLRIDEAVAPYSSSSNSLLTEEQFESEIIVAGKDNKSR